MNAQQQNNRDSYRVDINGTTYEVSFNDENSTAVIHGRVVALDVHLEREPDLYSILIDGKSVMMVLENSPEPGIFRVHAGGYDFEAEVASARESFLRDFIRSANVGRKENRVKAPMPGLIIKHLVKDGDEVVKGQGVMIMEAMKMENEIKAPANGTIKKLRVEEREAVEKGQVLFELV